jgi:hypothetical protein
VSLSNGTGTAVWEVLNTNPNTTENLRFGVYVTYSANVAQNSPLPGTSTVNLSFAPTAASGAASSSLGIPRFAGDSSAARNILTINICRTILLYPYITNQAGFDTGLTIANTSQDPYTTGSNATGAQSGSCKLTYYGGTTAAPTTPPGPSDTGNIAAGTVWVNTLQTIAPNFQGYMFAVCNFQFAHGFAFISDVGARNLAMGYLAVVLNDPGSSSRSNTNESFRFAVYITYSANVAQNSPLPGTSTVNLSFAPTATSGSASSTLSIPRFAGDASAARNILIINICRTILLYPYITNQAGFDTGLTIANTSQDSYTTGSNATGAQSGSCKLSYYGGTTAAPTTPPGPSDTGNIAAGTVWVNTLQTIAPNFQGYMFAVCNFQFAHGFAFISDVGARNLAMGYLAVVLNDPGSGSRSNTNTTTSENGAH